MNSRVLRFRLSDAEYQQLMRVAQRDEDTVSGIIREALYRKYGIGSIAATAAIQTLPQNGCRTPHQ